MKSKAMRVQQYKPGPKDLARIVNLFSLFNRRVRGPQYKPVNVGFKAIVPDAGCVGELVAMRLWGRLEITLLIVTEEYRKQGVGGQLLDTAEAYARRNKLAGIHLWTPSFQGEGFYESRGYKELGRMPLKIPKHFGGEMQYHIIYYKEFG